MKQVMPRGPATTVPGATATRTPATGSEPASQMTTEQIAAIATQSPLPGRGTRCVANAAGAQQAFR